MVNRKRTNDNTMVDKKRTNDNTMVNRKRMNDNTMVDKKLHRKLIKIATRIQVLRKGEQFLFH
jgi:hypothetical protein